MEKMESLLLYILGVLVTLAGEEKGEATRVERERGRERDVVLFKRSSNS